jgi:hypothetical protein
LNSQRRDVHPMEEAHGFHALLKLEEPKYTVEQIGAKVGKPPAYVASRARLTELIPAVVEAFYAEEIGVGHALLLAKLQPAQQEAALASCFREDWGGAAGKAKRIVLPVRHLQYWIEHNVLLLLKQAPFTSGMPNCYPPPEAASIAPSGQDKTSCFLQMSAGTQMRVPIQPAMPRSWRRTFRSRLQPSRR